MGIDKRIKACIPLALAILILIALVLFSGAEEIVNLLLKARVEFLFLAFTCWVASLVFRIIRWYVLLQSAGIREKLSSILKALLAGLALSNLTPGKLAEPLRAYFFKKLTKREISKVLPSIFVERILDFIAILTLSFFSLTALSGKIFYLFLLGVCFYTVVFGFGIYVLLSQRRIAKTTRFFAKILSFIPKVRKKANEIEGFAKTLHEAFKAQKSKRALILAFFSTVFIWILEGVTLYLCLLSIGAYVEPVVLITLFPLITVISLLSFLPGGLGAGEVLAVVVFSRLSTLSYAQLTAALILARVLGFWPTVVVGSYFAGKIKLKETRSP